MLENETPEDDTDYETIGEPSPPQPFDPATLDGMVDFVTVLTTKDEQRLLTKVNYIEEDGTPGQRDYDRAKWFNMEVKPVADLGFLEGVLDRIGPHSCVVYGKPIAGTDMRNCRRLAEPQKDGTPPTLEETPHRWVLFDFDKIDAVETDGTKFDPVADPERAARLLKMVHLPIDFTPTSCWWQLTSSAGLPGTEGKIRMRLAFWLDRPMTTSQLKWWLRAYRVDTSVFTPAQPVYVATPIFMAGAVDPVPARSGMCWSADGSDTVRVYTFDDDAYMAARERPKAERKTGGEGVAGEGDGENTVTREFLQQVLTWIDPGGPRDEWKDHIISIARAPLEGGWSDENRNYLRQRCHMFMAGEFYRARFVDPPDAQYRTEAEIDRVFDSAWGAEGARGFGSLVYAAQQAGMPHGRPAEETYGDPRQYAGYAEAAPPPDATEPKADHPRINLMNLSALRALPDPVDLVENMLVDRETVAIVGPPKSGKSYLATEIALSVAAACAVAGGHTVHRSGPVVYLSGEGHGGFKRRVDAWRRARGMSVAEFDALPFYYNRGVPLAAEGIKECKAFVDAIRAAVGEPVLVIIDTMARSLGGLDENAAASASLYLDMTEELRAGLNCTTLTIAHSSNKGDKPTLDFRGSSAFSAGFDSVWTLNKCDANGTVEFRGRWFKEHDVDSRGPHYFRLVHDETGATLAAAARPADRSSAEGRRNSLETTMRAYGMVGWRNALTDQEFAERRAAAYQEDATDELPPEDQARRYSEWAGAVAGHLKDLQTGAKGRGAQAAAYAGLFQAGIPMALASTQVGRRLRVVEQGKMAPTVTRLWFVSDNGAPV